MKKLIAIALATIIALVAVAKPSYAAPNPLLSVSAMSSIVATASPIILEFGSFDSDDIKDLRQGQGKIYKRIAKVIAQLQEEGTISENAQPVIAVVKQKKKGLLD